MPGARAVRATPTKGRPQGPPPEEPRIRAFPGRPKKVRTTPGTWLLFVVGLAMVGAGVGVTFMAGKVPDLQRLAETLQTYDLRGGDLLLSGVVLVGVAMACRYVRLHAATILAPGGTDDALIEVGTDIAEFRNKLTEFQNDHLHFRTEINSIKHEVQEHRRSDKAGETKDAIFRIAGGLDSLHAKLDQSLHRGVDGVKDAIGELSDLVEASRDFLQECVEENTSKSGGAIETLSEELRRMAGELHEAIANLHLAAPADEDVDGGLELALAPVTEEPDAYDDLGDDGGLGLLDDLDNVRDEHDDDDQGDDGGLGLLDSLDDEDFDEDDDDGDDRDDDAGSATEPPLPAPGAPAPELELPGSAPSGPNLSLAGPGGPGGHGGGAAPPTGLGGPTGAPQAQGGMASPPASIAMQPPRPPIPAPSRPGEPTVVNLDEEPPGPIPAPPPVADAAREQTRIGGPIPPPPPTSKS